MTIFSKTIRAADLPDDWRKEMGVDASRVVRVDIEEVVQKRSQAEIDALRAGLRSIVPVDIDGDMTEFIRAERDRLDGRNEQP